MKENLSGRDNGNSSDFDQRMKAEGYRMVHGNRNGKYRGKHRSQVKGVGIFAFFRNSWMKCVHGDNFLKS